MFTIITTDQFEHQARKFLKKHPDLKPNFRSIIEKLEKNPLDNKLRLHSLKGKLKGLYAISLTYSYRITLTFEINKKEIILLDIGSHDDVY